MENKKAYLTIDDAPSSDFLQKVDFLYAKNIPAIFFCLGENILKYENEVIYAIKKGYIIANHSMSHPYFSDLSLVECKNEIKRTDEIIDSIYSKSGIQRPAKYFRFPYFDKGGDIDGKAYQSRSQEPFYLRNPFPRDDKKRAIQLFLEELGYCQPNFQGINLKWFNDNQLLNAFDVHCSFDQMEYWLGKENAPRGLNKAETILARIDENNSEEGLSLNDFNTSDIILIHDHDLPKSIELFYKIINRYLDKNIQFALPKIF